MTNGRPAPGKADGWYWGRNELVSVDYDFFGANDTPEAAIADARTAQRDQTLEPNLYKVESGEIVEIRLASTETTSLETGYEPEL